jgi:hypothetical protein
VEGWKAGVTNGSQVSMMTGWHLHGEGIGVWSILSDLTKGKGGDLFDMILSDDDDA